MPAMGGDCCGVVVGLVPHPGRTCQDHYLELVQVFKGVNPVHPVPLAQALEKWPNLAFALEFGVLAVKARAAAENL